MIRRALAVFLFAACAVPATAQVIRVVPLARDNPNLQVLVHPFGAPHIVDPSKLVASATRIYGDRMEPLWGEFCPIQPTQVRELIDGEVRCEPAATIVYRL